VTNGNGNRRCDNLLATLPLFEIAIVLLRLDYVGSVPVLGFLIASKRMLFQLLAAFDAGPGDGLPLIRHLFVRKTQI
jgi:hypothetical protein